MSVASVLLQKLLIQSFRPAWVKANQFTWKKNPLDNLVCLTQRRKGLENESYFSSVGKKNTWGLRESFLPC